jgi:hypothetical protein
VWVKKNGARVRVEGEVVTAQAYEHAFRYGCAVRIKNRLWERYHDQTSTPVGLLVKSNVPALYTKLSAEVSDYMSKNHADLMVRPNKGKHTSHEGALDGDRAGKHVSLDTQIGAEPKPMIGGVA